MNWRSSRSSGKCKYGRQTDKLYQNLKNFRSWEICSWWCFSRNSSTANPTSTNQLLRSIGGWWKISKDKMDGHGILGGALRSSVRTNAGPWPLQNLMLESKRKEAMTQLICGGGSMEDLKLTKNQTAHTSLKNTGMAKAAQGQIGNPRREWTMQENQAKISIYWSAHRHQKT